MKLILIALLIGSCSFKKNNQKQNGHEELYSEPDAPKLKVLDPQEKRIVIASTNDIQGSYSPQEITVKDKVNADPQTIRLGGQEVIKSYFDILRATYNNVVLVDSGNILLNGNDLDSVKNFYEKNQYDAFTVGLRDFNLKVPTKYGNNVKLFQNFAKKSKVPLLLSNLYELKTARGVEWEGSEAHLVKTVDGVKVGIIGLIPDDIVKLTPVNNRVGLFVENMLQSTLRHARLLRSLGADLIVVLTHQGIECGNDIAEEKKIPLSKVNFDPLHEKACDLKSPLGVYLERLPPNLVDVVIGGRVQQKIVNVINGTLVMSGFENGKSFNYVEFVLNSKTGKIDPEKTVIHQPVMFCHEFFKETKDCYTEDPTVDHKKKIPATFLGKPVQGDALSSAQKEAHFNGKKNQERLQELGADLSYTMNSSGESQLVMLKYSAHELHELLEEDFNNGRKAHWFPSPFLLKGNELTLSLNGEELQTGSTYKVLTDLESIQKHKRLLKKIHLMEFEALMNHSWNSGEDQVSTQLASQQR